MKINFIQDTIDIFRGKRITKLSMYFASVEQKKLYDKFKRNLAKKIRHGEKIKTAFLVANISVFSSQNVFEQMLRDDIFDPYIIAIPDVTKGVDFEKEQLNKIVDEFSGLYGDDRVLSSLVNGIYLDIVSDYDLVFFANPYDALTHEFYKIEYIAHKALTCFVPYAFFVTNYIKKFTSEVKELKLFWKIFLESEGIKEYYVKLGKICSENLCVSGYPRTDDLYTIEKVKRDRKKIIIAPHSVSLKNTEGIEFAEFLKFHDCILNLPKLYPQIDFVFRPHPFLFVNLQNEGIWTEEMVNTYITQMKSYSNVTYQDGGSFAFDFVNSDGIIHDCGSFLPEYMITNNPTCYLQTNKEIYDKFFIELGQNCLDNCYIADTEEKILNFIDNIILNNNDLMKVERSEFVKNNLTYNKGQVSKFILNFLKKQLGVKID